MGSWACIIFLAPQRLPESSDRQYFFPDRLSLCPYRQFVLLSDPTWIGICLVRFAVDFVPVNQD